MPMPPGQGPPGAHALPTSKQLQAQLADLMAVVTEERRLCQFSKIELCYIRGNPPPGLNLPQTCWHDRRKIIFMLTNLSGNTAKWAQPLNQRVLNKSDPDHKGKSQKALCTFKQSGNVESYTQQFNVHDYDSAWSANSENHSSNLENRTSETLKLNLNTQIFSHQVPHRNQSRTSKPLPADQPPPDSAPENPFPPTPTGSRTDNPLSPTHLQTLPSDPPESGNHLDERRLCQLSKIELRNIRGNPPPHAPPSTAHSLACLPKQFDGTRGPAAQAFLQQTSLYCLAHPDQFPDDHRKIIFMLTNLSGNTTKLAQPLNQWVLNKSDLDMTPPNLAEFITSFNGYFLNPECKGKSQKALYTFKQSGNMDSYTQQFNIHTYDSAWSDNILHSPPSPKSRPWPCNSAKNLKLTTATLSKSAHQPTPLPQPTQLQWTLGNERPPARL
ncbi:uncharacterized protein VP01_1685g6 [Puccinia sorghi]|uniref:Retrotransposon gag domain-containing protein n=1 Tax=Puccinia sorghi TaxID=27349 RepID=A0A0L6VGG6_9BASI|nr:uncharacterized protein VP01_1685g6 [Puccinia sorghi]